MTPRLVIVFATKGSDSNEERRLCSLAQPLRPERFPYDRTSKARSFLQLLRLIRRQRPELMVMEGTGLAGGLACLLGRLIMGVPYVVSSGDAVGPWVGTLYPVLRPPFALYERILCRMAAGFIGWTPYLVGRALTFGTPRAMTAAGWAEFTFDTQSFADARKRVRQQLGIPHDAITFGIVGSLVWTQRYNYCYGAELVRAIKSCRRPDVCVLVVGGGSGLEHLRALAGSDLGQRVFLTDGVPADQVPAYLAAMDVGSLPQSVDGVGSFRYTTKVSEYITARLPFVTGQIPLSYDLDQGGLWRLPGAAPWEQRYLDALTALMDRLPVEEIAARRSALGQEAREFDRDAQVTRASAFLNEILNDRRTRSLK